MVLALELVMDLFVKALRRTLQVLELVMSMFTAVLQSMPSPLGACACISVADGSEAQSCFHVAPAVTSLCLAVCNLHVPRFIFYHDPACRFLSAISMQALFPYSPTLSCLAFPYPTFGKGGRALLRRRQSLEPVPQSTFLRRREIRYPLVASSQKLKAAGNEDTC